MLKNVSSLLFILLFGLFAIGCEDDDDGGDSITDPNGEDANEFQIDATSHDHYAYFNLTTGSMVDVSDEQAEGSNDWHIAFKRYEAKINGGVSGPLGIKAVDLEKIGHEKGTDFDGLTEVPALEEDYWQTDDIKLVLDGWYIYDPETHEVNPSGRLFAMRTADGKYAKIEVVDTIKVAGRGMIGGVGLKYALGEQSASSYGESHNVQLNDDGGNSIFFSFDAGGEVQIADPEASTEWDIWFDGFDAKINGGIHGPGACAVYPIYRENNNYDELTEVPMDMGGSYEEDTISSIFDEWYNYGGEGHGPHELWSKGHVYLLKIDAGTVFKLEIANYYKSVEGDAVSGWITIRYLEL